jgi:hypothetical protein
MIFIFFMEGGGGGVLGVLMPICENWGHPN